MKLEISRNPEHTVANVEWSYGTESGRSSVHYRTEHSEFKECFSERVEGDALPDEILEDVLRYCETN